MTNNEIINNFIQNVKKEVGYKEEDKHINKYTNRIRPWSYDFVKWVIENNEPKIHIEDSLDLFIENIKKNNKWLSLQNDKSGPQIGDILFFSFKGIDKNNEINHVGVCIKNLGNGIISAIEGNTCDNSKGNQRDGGLVLKKIRAWTRYNYKDIPMSIVGWYRPYENFVAEEKSLDVNKEVKKVAKKKSPSKNNTSSRTLKGE